MCGDYLQKILCPENCCEQLRLVDLYFHHEPPPFAIKAVRLLAQRFDVISATHGFVEVLSIGRLEDAIKNRLVACTAQLTSSVLRWCEFDKVNRASFLPALMTDLCLPLLSLGFLREVVNSHPLVEACSQSSALVADAMKLLTHHGAENQRRLAQLRCEQSRRGDGHRTIAVGLGEAVNFSGARNENDSPHGSDALILQELCPGNVVKDSNVSGLKYDSNDLLSYHWEVLQSPFLEDKTRDGTVHCWKTKMRLDTQSHFYVDCLHGTASAGGYLFVLFSSCGRGSNNVETVEHTTVSHYHFHMYDVFTCEWTELEVPHTLRYACGMAALMTADGAEVLIVGGERLLPRPDDDDFNVLSSVERFSLESRSWKPAPSLPGPRKYPSLVALQGSYYVLGGDDPGTDTILRLEQNCGIEDLSEDRTWSWREQARLGMPRAQMVAATVPSRGEIETPHCVYLARGVDARDGAESLTLECFDSLTGEVTLLPPLPCELFDFGMFFHCSKQAGLESSHGLMSLHTCGGYTDESFSLKLRVDFTLPNIYEDFPPTNPRIESDKIYGIPEAVKIRGWIANNSRILMPVPMLNCSVHVF